MKNINIIYHNKVGFTMNKENNTFFDFISETPLVVVNSFFSSRKRRRCKCRQVFLQKKYIMR